MKTKLVTSHLDLDEISMVGPLKRGPEGNWVFGVMWKRTGNVGNVDATPEIDQDKRFSLSEVDESRPIAEKNYAEFVRQWYGHPAFAPEQVVTNEASQPMHAVPAHD